MEQKSINSKMALFVIDMQEDYTGEAAKPPFPYKDAEKLIDAVNGIIEAASRKNIAIVYIRQEFEGILGRIFSKLFCNGTAIKGNPGTELDKRINLKSGNCFSKPAPDAFSNPKLKEYLDRQMIHEIFLVGLDAEFCVRATAKGALKHGYTVSIIKDAIALKAEAKWDKILQEYERGGIHLISGKEF